MADPKKTWQTPKNFWVLVVAGLLAVSGLGNSGFEELLNNVLKAIPAVKLPVTPRPDLGGLSEPYRQLWLALAPLESDERRLLGEYYSGLARAVEADPPDEPVLTTTESLRAAHRAGLLFVWRGTLAVTPDRYPNLRGSIEGVLSSAIGDKDIPLNAALKQQAAICFRKVAELCNTKS